MKYNFFFGANGTRKSTISRLLSGEIKSSDCSIDWALGAHEDIIVYNRGFVLRNFSTDKILQDIFTLGEDFVELQQQIENIKTLIDNGDNEKH